MVPQSKTGDLLRIFTNDGEFIDAAWLQLRHEAEMASVHSPALALLCSDSIINQPGLEEAMFHRIAGRLACDLVPQGAIEQAFRRAAAATPELRLGLKHDLAAVFDRDPACRRVIEPFLYFKGFHTLQAHRLAHWLWTSGERDFALYLQSTASEVFQTDIHPAAKIVRTTASSDHRRPISERLQELAYMGFDYAI